MSTIDRVLAAIPVAFGTEFSGKAWSKGGYDRVYVTRYGRQERGYVEVSSDGELDSSNLDLAGMSDDTVASRLAASVAVTS